MYSSNYFYYHNDTVTSVLSHSQRGWPEVLSELLIKVVFQNMLSFPRGAPARDWLGSRVVVVVVVVVVEEWNIIIIVKCRTSRWSEVSSLTSDHSGENGVVVAKITDSEEEIREWIDDGGCHLHSRENLLAWLNPCRLTDISISNHWLHSDFIFGPFPVIRHNRVLESLGGIC